MDEVNDETLERLKEAVIELKAAIKQVEEGGRKVSVWVPNFDLAYGQVRLELDGYFVALRDEK